MSEDCDQQTSRQRLSDTQNIDYHTRHLMVHGIRFSMGLTFTRHPRKQILSIRHRSARAGLTHSTVKLLPEGSASTEVGIRPQGIHTTTGLMINHGWSWHVLDLTEPLFSHRPHSVKKAFLLHNVL